MLRRHQPDPQPFTQLGIQRSPARSTETHGGDIVIVTPAQHLGLGPGDQAANQPAVDTDQDVQANTAGQLGSAARCNSRAAAKRLQRFLLHSGVRISKGQFFDDGQNLRGQVGELNQAAEGCETGFEVLSFEISEEARRVLIGIWHEAYLRWHRMCVL